MYFDPVLLFIELHFSLENGPEIPGFFLTDATGIPYIFLDNFRKVTYILFRQDAGFQISFQGLRYFGSKMFFQAHLIGVFPVN
jgi:hypothetical protein